MQTLKFESMYHCWELYALIAQQSTSYQAMTADFVARMVAKREFKRPISILEPFSGPIPYFRSDIIHFCTKLHQTVSAYDCVEFIDHGKLSRNNEIIIDDICTYSSKNQYDVIFVSYGSMACMLSDASQDPYEKLQKALRNMYKLLAPNGIFILNTNSACTIVYNDIISPKHKVRRKLTKDDLLVKHYELQLPASISYTYLSYYDRTTGQCLCLYKDIEVHAKNKQLSILLERPTVISAFCEPEFIRNAGMAGWDLSLSEYYTLDQDEGYPTFVEASRMEYNEFVPSEMIVLKKKPKKMV